MSSHLPIRPGWICGGCGRDWPCRTRRDQLVAEYDGAVVSLGLYMGASFTTAAQDLPAGPSGELYERMPAWVNGEAVADAAGQYLGW